MQLFDSYNYAQFFEQRPDLQPSRVRPEIFCMCLLWRLMYLITKNCAMLPFQGEADVVLVSPSEESEKCYGWRYLK